MRPERKKLLLLYNPVAGRGTVSRNIPGILEMYTKKGFLVTCYPTSFSGDGRQFAENIGKDEYDLIVCAGGDGTLDEVAAGMQKRKFLPVPIGYIPAGSTNDFARSAGIPKDIMKAAELAVREKERKFDLGKFGEDRFFVYVAAFGIFTDVSYDTPQEFKNALGHMAYILNGIKELGSIHPYHMRISCNEKILEDDFLFGMVSNSLSVGGLRRITGPNVDLSDGLFEVTLIRCPKDAVELSLLIGALNRLEFDDHHLINFKTTQIRFAAESAVNWTLDGEFGGAHTQITLQNITHGLCMIAPEERSRK